MFGAGGSVSVVLIHGWGWLVRRPWCLLITGADWSVAVTFGSLSPSPRSSSSFLLRTPDPDPSVASRRRGAASDPIGGRLSFALRSTSLEQRLSHRSPRAAPRIGPVTRTPPGQIAPLQDAHSGKERVGGLALRAASQAGARETLGRPTMVTTNAYQLWCHLKSEVTWRTCATECERPSMCTHKSE
jgi:hypothetical protein